MIPVRNGCAWYGTPTPLHLFSWIDGLGIEDFVMQYASFCLLAAPWPESKTVGGEQTWDRARQAGPVRSFVGHASHALPARPNPLVSLACATGSASPGFSGSGIIKTNSFQSMVFTFRHFSDVHIFRLPTSETFNMGNTSPHNWMCLSWMCLSWLWLAWQNGKIFMRWLHLLG